MAVVQKLQDAYSAVSKIGTWKQLSNVSLAAFVVSLTGIPGVSQAATVLDRIAGDAAKKRDLEAIWAELKRANAHLDSLDDSVERLQEIANTVAYNSQIAEQLKTLVTDLLDALAGQGSEWNVLTKNWSFQAILNSFANIDEAKITAINNSHNVVQNTQIHASRTDLVADKNSSNIVDKSSFHGSKGSVSMDALRAQGPVSVQGASVGFGPGGGIAFGEGGMLGFGPPQTALLGTCSRCGRQFNVDISRGVPAWVQCPGCYAVLQTQR
jgi:hypothetical protein